MRKLNKNKKAVSAVANVMVAILILLVLAFSIIYINNTFFKEAKITADKLLKSSEHDLCKLEGEKEEPGTFLDVDEDGFPDKTCDNCVCRKGRGCDNNIDDHNKDYIPRGCQDGDDQPGSPNTGKFSKACLKNGLIDGRCNIFGTIGDGSNLKERKDPTLKTEEETPPAENTKTETPTTETPKIENSETNTKTIELTKSNPCLNLACTDIQSTNQCIQCKCKTNYGIFNSFTSCTPCTNKQRQCQDYKKEKECIADPCEINNCEWSGIIFFKSCKPQT